MKKSVKLLLLSILASGCTLGDDYGPTYQHYLEKKGITAPQVSEFEHCHGYGCKHVQKVSLTAKQWQAVDAVFTSPAPKSPDEERARIAKAIGIFETEVGALAGTDEDQWGTFRKMGTYQHDCVDESTNTTIYLSLLHARGLMKHHAVEPPNVRLPIINAGRWPHQTAVISENKTGSLFAVDSWFHDNGIAAEIVPLKQWKDGWKPDKG